MMKKFGGFLLILICLFLMPFDVDARSIADYRKEIADIQAEKVKNEKKSAEVEGQIAVVKEKINSITVSITKAVKEQEDKEKEIDELDKKIDIKKEQLKDLASFLQVSENENFYLKYVFGAEDFEDFIYRFSVIQQLSETNDNLVKEMNQLIEENKQKIKELDDKKKELDELDNQMQVELDKLGDQKDAYMDTSISYDQKISVIQKQINYYKKQGCGETEDFSSCIKSGNIPSASGFIRPVAHGYIMNDGQSEFGWRIHPISHVWKFHEGVDINGFGYGASILAAATGSVAYTGVWGGGGKTVILYHNVNGRSYTTMYFHLSSISVSMGEIVLQGQKVGGAGSTGNSTGVHLHFQVISGHRSYYSSSQLINPRNVVNFPRAGSWW